MSLRLRKCHSNLYSLFGKHTVVEVLKNRYGNWEIEVLRRGDKKVYKPELDEKGCPTLETANEVACEIIDNEDNLTYIKKEKLVCVNNMEQHAETA